MTESRVPRRHAARCLGLAVLVTAALIVPTTEAVAEQLLVDCTVDPQESINAAINSLAGRPPAVGQWDVIYLRGDCKQSVMVTGGRRLWIAPESVPCCQTNGGGRATITAPGTVITVRGPQDVTLVNLDLIGSGGPSGGGAGLAITGTASVATYGVVAEDNGSAGFLVGAGAALTMNGGGALRNGWYGINLAAGATATLYGMRPSAGEPQPIVVSGNTGGGIRVDRGHLYAHTGYIIENNLGPALTAYAGVAILADYRAPSESVVQGNQGGVFASEGSQITFFGKVALRDNGSYGVYVEDGGNASFIAHRDPVSGESRTVVVEGHTTVGVEVVANSQAAFHGSHVVRANGSSAGVWIDGGSHAYFDDMSPTFVDKPPEIVDNAGHGILVTLNSSIDARAGIVQGNGRAGIVISGQSVGYLGADSRLLGSNGRGSLHCDHTSLVLDVLDKGRQCVDAKPVESRPQRPEMPK